jgi:hypothetical protein
MAPVRVRQGGILTSHVTRDWTQQTTGSDDLVTPSE